MIYLLRSSAMVSGLNKEKQENKIKLTTILKIGWTLDSKAKQRFDTYRAHNPTIQVLKVFPEFGLEVEKVLHSKFSHIRFPDTSEWYLDCAEIINFFFSLDATQELKKMDEEVKVSMGAWEKKRTLLCYLLRTITLKSWDVLECTSDEKEFWELLEERYSEENLRELKKKEILVKSLPKEFNNLLKDMMRLKTIEKKAEILKTIPIEDLEHFSDLGLVEKQVENFMLFKNGKE